MPDLEPQQSDAAHADVDITEIDAPESDLPARPSQREGLPPHYRMRAERHYVDHLSAPSAGFPVRMIPINQLTPRPSTETKDLETLIRSVRDHGVIQPLLVRRDRSIYHVIAGRHRLAAALAAGLGEVPCIVHQVDEAGAAALEAAEQVQADRGEPVPSAVSERIVDGVQEIADDLGRLRMTLGLLRDSPKGFQQAVAVDLVAAQSWRTLWLAGAAALIAGREVHKGRERSLAAIVDDVVEEFEPECRLSRARILVSHLGAALPRVPEGSMRLALTGAIFVTLALVDSRVEPTVEIHCQTTGDRAFTVDVVQRQVAISKEVAERFSSHSASDRLSGTAGVGALVLSRVTGAFRGTSELLVTGEPGSTLRMTFSPA